ncbi:MAG: hypothetical protein EBE86_026720 [Hormoscilla sp. GUM202]|nr:hypothetical protein [Hormoscilla sp. GUM202]
MEYLKQVEAQAAQPAKAAEGRRALATTVDKIRQSLDIDTIFETTTQEVRRLLEVERVDKRRWGLAFRFFRNGRRAHSKSGVAQLRDDEHSCRSLKPKLQASFSYMQKRASSPKCATPKVQCHHL